MIGWRRLYLSNSDYAVVKMSKKLRVSQNMEKFLASASERSPFSGVNLPCTL
jgi:hypothetical protein